MEKVVTYCKMKAYTTKKKSKRKQTKKQEKV